MSKPASMDRVSAPKQDPPHPQLFKSIIDESPDVIVGVDEAGSVIFANRRARALFGLSADSPVERPFWELLDGIAESASPPASAAPKFEPSPIAQADAPRLGGGPGGEAAAPVSSASHVWEPCPVLALPGDVRVYRLRNIARRVELEAELRFQSERGARLDTALAQLTRMAAHDLQEPLRMVVSHLQLLERGYRHKLDATATEHISYAVEGVKRMHRLLRGILESSKLEERPLEPSLVAVNDVLQSTRRAFAKTIAAAGGTLMWGPMPTVQGDADGLETLLHHLVDNALKFRGADAPAVRVSAKRKGGFWQITVSDNGIGIDPSAAERVFEPFQRLNRRNLYPGTGVGLTVCRGIVESLGGSIWVDAECSKGCAVSFTLQSA